MMDTATYTINDLERLTGIKAHTLRIWEKRYGIGDPGRSNGNIRQYNDEDLRYMLSISILKKKGHKISQIAALNPSDLYRKVSSELSSRNGDSRIEAMILTMISLDESGFREILGNAIMELGIEDTFAQLISPFFDRIGTMWLAGTINPAQEHFVTNIIRQKLIVAINNTQPQSNENSKRFLLFLPEGEQHEIGLLLYTYIIKRAGHKVTYLGQSTPRGCINNIMESHPADVLMTSITTAFDDESLNEYLLGLSNDFKETPILVSGIRVWNDDEPELPQVSNIIRLAGSSSIKAYLSKIGEEADA